MQVERWVQAVGVAAREQSQAAAEGGYHRAPQGVPTARARWWVLPREEEAGVESSLAAARSPCPWAATEAGQQRSCVLASLTALYLHTTQWTAVTEGDDRVCLETP